MIVPSSTTTAASGTGAAPLPSTSRPLAIKVTPWAVFIAVASLWAACSPHHEAIPGATQAASALASREAGSPRGGSSRAPEQAGKGQKDRPRRIRQDGRLDDPADRAAVDRPAGQVDHQLAGLVRGGEQQRHARDGHRPPLARGRQSERRPDGHRQGKDDRVIKPVVEEEHRPARGQRRRDRERPRPARRDQQGQRGDDGGPLRGRREAAVAEAEPVEQVVERDHVAACPRGQLVIVHAPGQLQRPDLAEVVLHPLLPDSGRTAGQAQAEGDDRQGEPGVTVLFAEENGQKGDHRRCLEPGDREPDAGHRRPSLLTRPDRQKEGERRQDAELPGEQAEHRSGRVHQSRPEQHGDVTRQGRRRFVVTLSPPPSTRLERGMRQTAITAETRTQPVRAAG